MDYTTELRKAAAASIRGVRIAQQITGKRLAPWDTCILAANGYDRCSLVYATIREVAIKFKPIQNVILRRI